MKGWALSTALDLTHMPGIIHETFRPLISSCTQGRAILTNVNKLLRMKEGPQGIELSK